MNITLAQERWHAEQVRAAIATHLQASHDALIKAARLADQEEYRGFFKLVQTALAATQDAQEAAPK